jgi:GNAT superfamily N-acetyltransferase
MIISRATADHLGELLPLVEEFYAIDGHDWDAGLVTGALGPLLADDTYGFVLLAEGAYAVVCFSYSLESGGRDACLDEIYVRDRGRGLGAALLSAALDRARDGGARRMLVETEAHNTRVRGFYGRHGFEVDDSIWMSRPL